MFTASNWIIDNLENSLQTWNDKLGEIWQLITQTPQSFKGGQIWSAILQINNAVKAIALALLVLFFVMGVVKTCSSLTDVKKPEHAFKLFFRFAISKAFITYGLDFMLAIFKITQGLISTIMQTTNIGVVSQVALPEEIINAVKNCGFLNSIPLWSITLIGSLFISIMSFILILTVYGRYFKMYLYVALAPIPLSTIASETTQNVAKSFFKSFTAVCLEGAIVVIACIIFSLFASSPPVIDSNVSAATMVWKYIAELIFNMLVLVGTVKMSDRVVREMMGL